jgi:hypothetical protein
LFPRDFDLDYRIKVPRNTNLIVDHQEGEVHFDEVTGDIHATTVQGTTTVHLPQTGKYTINAKSKLGAVISDFPGTTKRKRWFGHEFAETSQAPHNLYMRSGFGDFVILKIRTTALTTTDRFHISTVAIPP